MRGGIQHSASQPPTAGPASSSPVSSDNWAGLSLQRAPPAPLEAGAGRPPEASARRHRLADILLTWNRVATSRSLAPSPIPSAAASRTRSRRARSSAVSPLRRGTSRLRHSAHRAARQLSSNLHR